MVFKIRYIDPKVGGHVYCRLYSAPQINETYSQLTTGSITVRRGEEFDALRAAMSGVTFEEQTNGATPWGGTNTSVG